MGLLGEHSTNTRRWGWLTGRNWLRKGVTQQADSWQKPQRLFETEHIILWENTARAVPHVHIKGWANKLLLLCLASYHSQLRRTEVRDPGKLYFILLTKRQFKRPLSCRHVSSVGHTGPPIQLNEWATKTEMSLHPWAFCGRRKKEKALTRHHPNELGYHSREARLSPWYKCYCKTRKNH